MTFDIEAAKKSGYTTDEITNYLAEQQKFDIGSAIDVGYSREDILSYLAGQDTKAEAKPKYDVNSPEFKKWQEQSAITQWRGENPIKANIADAARGFGGITGRGAESIMNKMFPQETTQDITRDSGYKVAGEVLSPESMVMFGGGLKAASQIPRAGEVTKRIIGGTIGGGLIGAASENGDTGSGAAIGGASMAIIPPALQAMGKYVGRPLYHLIERALPFGAEQIQGRTLNKAAGDLMPKVISELKQAESGLTAGQASVEANSPTFAALQREVSQLKPAEYDAIKQAQESDRLMSLRTIGKDSPHPDAPSPNMNIATISRENVANRLYGDAFAADDMRLAALKQRQQEAQGLRIIGRGQPVQMLDERLIPVTKNSLIMDVAEQVKKSNPELGNPIESLRGLDRIKKMIDEDIFAIRNKSPTAMQNVNEASLTRAKSVLLNSMENLNPTYRKARDVFSERSIPINQMQIGQVLEDALTASVSQAERGAYFSNKVRDAAKIIATKTGQARYDKLSELFTEKQMGIVNKTIYQLNRDSRFQELAQSGGKAISRQLGDTSHEIKPVNFLSRTMTLINAAINKVQGTAGEKTLNELSVIMRDPKLTAQIMEKASAREKLAIKMFQNMQTTTTIVTGQSINVQQGQQQ